MTLFINTCIENKIILALKRDSFIIKKETALKSRQSEKIIELLDKFLKNHKIDIKNISAIIVVNGPGKFTAARAGVNAANALSYGLQIPIIALRLDAFFDLKDAFDCVEKKNKKIKKTFYIKPFYDKEPNITSKKQ